MIDLTSKLGEITDIEHNKDSKIYPQNQVIFDCIMPSIPLKHKCLRGHSFSLKKKKKKKKKFFFFLDHYNLKKKSKKKCFFFILN